jgi:AcrR family transcriptional regulator
VSVSPPPEVDGRTRRAAKKRERRRRTVLDAGLRVFSDKGYHQTRVSDIIEEAGIARGTFYLYFDSKNAIFHELLDRLLERIGANVVGVDLGDEAPPVRDQLLVSVRRILGAFREDPALAKFVLREAVGIDAEIDKKLEDFYDQLHVWLSASLENGQRIGLVRAIDTESVAWCIIGSVKQFLQLVLEKPDSDLDLDHLSEVILDFNLQGIRAS